MNPRSAIGGVFACATLTLFPIVGVGPALAQEAQTATSPWGSLAGVSIARKTDTSTALSFSPTAPAAAPDHATPVEVPPKAASVVRHRGRTATAKAEHHKPKAAASPAPEPAAPQIGSGAPAPAAADAAPTAEVAAAATPTSNEVSVGGPGSAININTAPVTALDRLGSGRVGRAIVNHRPYRSIDELVDRKVLRSSDFQKLRSKITVETAS